MVGAMVPSTRPPWLHSQCPSHSSSSPYLLAFPGLPISPRCIPIAPCFRVPRPRSRAAMSAIDSTAAGSVGASSDAEVGSLASGSVGQNDLLIVGPGVLGRIVADMWKQEHPGCRVFGQTATTDHHSELTELGIIPSLKGSIAGPKFPHVIFCAPPYCSDDYPADLRVAASNWNGEGSFLFTSSTAVYDCSDNGLCNESLCTDRSEPSHRCPSKSRKCCP